MKTSYSFLLTSSLALLLLTAQGNEVLFRADFTDTNVWQNLREYPSRDKFPGGAIVWDCQPDALTVTGTPTNDLDTAWMLGTKMMPWSHAGKYAYAFTFASKGLKVGGFRPNGQGINNGVTEVTAGHDNSVCWYDKDGNLLERHFIPLLMADIAPYEYRFVREVPQGAVQFRVNIGWDIPNMIAGRTARFENVRIEAAGDDEPVGVKRPDVYGPRVRIVSETPTRNATAPAVVSIADPSGVDADSIEVEVDGKEVKVKGEGEQWSDDHTTVRLHLSPSPASSTWSEGLHWIKVRAKDKQGLVTEQRKCFLVGDCPKTPRTTMRDDGVTLVDGEPFFPIGIYGVNKRDFNAYNWERAISDLRQGGFNTVFSYTGWPDPGYHAMAKKYGMKMWMIAHNATKDPMWIDRFRNNPWVISWYLGDDTSRNTQIDELYDRDDNIRAVDPTRVTTEADVYRPPLELYLPASDIFLPELYPLRCKTEKENRQCVAVVNSTMREIAAAQSRDPYGRPHGIWPIIQNFKGYIDWKRYPTPEEFYAMCFGSIVHGATGITLYTYGGYYNEKEREYTFGVTGTEEAWRTTTNCMSRIASLAPVLLERTPAQPPAPKVTAGPAHDGVDGRSVTALMKVKDGVKYLIAVNSADAKVTASFSPNATGKVEVMWEKRTLAPDEKGAFTDTFAPLAVHVYRFL